MTDGKHDSDSNCGRMEAREWEGEEEIDAETCGGEALNRMNFAQEHKHLFVISPNSNNFLIIQSCNNGDIYEN